MKLGTEGSHSSLLQNLGTAVPIESLILRGKSDSKMQKYI